MMYFVGVIGDDDNVYVSWDSDEKAQIDPCPPGYRAPASSVWTTDVGSSHTTLANAFLYWNADSDIYYPYSEYLINESGDPHESEKDQLSDYNYTSVTNIWAVLTTYNLRIKYKGKYSIERGVLWASDYAIDYYTRFNDIADKKILEYKTNRQDWSKAKNIDLESISSLGRLGELLNDAANGLIDGIAISDISILKNTEPLNNYYAAQVRCVMEKEKNQNN